MIFIPVTISTCFVENAFILMGQDPYVASQAQKYIIWMIPGNACFVLNHSYSKFLAGQKEVKFQMYTSVIAFVLHIPISIFFEGYYGLFGIAIASNIHLFLRFIIIQTFIKRSRFNDNLVYIRDPDNFKNLKPQFLMSIYGCGMIIWAWWAFDVFTFLGTFMSE